MLVKIIPEEYPNHNSIVVHLLDPEEKLEAHSRYRANLIIKLLEKHGEIKDVDFDVKLQLTFKINQTLWKVVKSIIMLRRVTLKMWRELQRTLDDLDEFRLRLRPYIIEQQL